MPSWIGAFMLFALVIPANAAPLLRIDFNHRTNDPIATTHSGFTSFLITSNGSPTSAQTNVTIRMIGTNRVTLWGNGSNRGYVDRWHALPTNEAAFTQSLLLRDCVYSPDTTTNGGLNVLIENLPVSNRVQVTIWSYDVNSEPIRASDWYANGFLVRRAYQFTNSVAPTNNEQYRFSFVATVSGSGQLLIEGRRNPMSISPFQVRLPAVFLNALRIDPEPLDITSVVISGSDLVLEFVVRPEPGTYGVEQTTGGPWSVTSGVTFSLPANNRVTARFPRPNRPTIYRIRYGN